MSEDRSAAFVAAVACYVTVAARQFAIPGAELVNLTADVAALVAVQTAEEGREMLAAQVAAARLLERAPEEIAERAAMRLARQSVVGRA